MRFGDIAIEKLLGQQEKLLTVDTDGIIISTGVDVADISGGVFTELEMQIQDVSASSYAADVTLQNQITDISGSAAFLSSNGNVNEVPYFTSTNTLAGTANHTWNESTQVLTISGILNLSDSNGNVAIVTNSTIGGTDNIFIGNQSGDGNTGSASTFIGERSGLNNSNTRVIGIGSEAGNGNQGTECVGVGDDSIKLNEGNRCIGIGGDSVREQTGNDVIGLGRSSCQFNTGQRVLSWGNESGYQNTGNDCVFIGVDAGKSNTTDYRFILCSNDSSSSPYILIDGNFDNKTLDLNADITAFSCDVSGDVSVGTLPSGNAGNILTWNASGQLIDSGTSISAAAALISNNASDIAVNTAAIAAIEDNVISVENTDVDTGTETLDSITMTVGAVWWDVVHRKGNNIRSGSIIANVVNSTVQWSYSGFTGDNGNTSDISYNVTYSGGDLILQVTAASDNWDVKAFRRVLTY